MLSNKLTFSLVFIVMFAVVFAAMPAVAQQVTAVQIPAAMKVGIGHDATDTGGITHRFLVVQSNDINGLLHDGDSDTPRRPLTGAGTQAANNVLTADTSNTEAALPDFE